MDTICGTCKNGGRIAGRIKLEGRWVTLLRCERWDKTVRISDACVEWQDQKGKSLKEQPKKE